MRAIEKIELIYRDPTVRGGRPCIVGRGLRVMDIVMEQQYGEKDPEKIATLYDHFEPGLRRIGILSRAQRGNRR